LALRGDEGLLAGLLAGKSVAVAARDAGMSVATAHRRVGGDAAFRRRLDEARQARTTALAFQLAESAAEAHAVLCELMRDETAAPMARVRAAGLVLSTALHLSEAEDARGELAERLETLEQEQAARSFRPSRLAIEAAGE